MDGNPEQTAPRQTRSAQDEILSRRAVLRGVLITGCCMFAPITLLGACSKEAESALPPKLSQAQVKYQTQPRGAQQCSNCMNFESRTRTCQRVEGQVSPDGWCVLWARNA